MVRCTINLENNNRSVYYAGDLLKGEFRFYCKSAPNRSFNELKLQQEPLNCTWTSQRSSEVCQLPLISLKKCRNSENNLFQKNSRSKTILLFMRSHYHFHLFCSGLYLNVYGAAKCHWTEAAGDGQKLNTTIHYKGKDVYLNTKTYLFGSEDGNAIEKASGIHKYHFTCLLPAQLPASFEASHGNICYNIEAVLDIPWGFNKYFKLHFALLRHDDLNSLPELAIPSISEEIKQFCCCFCLSDPLIMTVTLPCSGFTPGQSIPIKISYSNKSTVNVVESNISLKRIICYNRLVN